MEIKKAPIIECVECTLLIKKDLLCNICIKDCHNHKHESYAEMHATKETPPMCLCRPRTPQIEITKVDPLFYLHLVKDVKPKFKFALAESIPEELWLNKAPEGTD